MEVRPFKILLGAEKKCLFSGGKIDKLVLLDGINHLFWNFDPKKNYDPKNPDPWASKAP